MTGPKLLTVENVSKIFRMGEVEVCALREATIDIYDGEFLVVVGPSGSGKTTLLNMVGGMDRPTSGTIRFLEEDISGYSDRELTVFRRTQVGFVFQFFNLIPTLTVLENVQVATEIVGEALDPAEMLSMVSLSDRLDHFPSQLSGGEQQRVAVARALASNPRMILCDEPTGALDSETGAQVLELLVKLKDDLGKTVILITHNTVIGRVADRVAVLHDGAVARISENETPASPAQIRW